MKKRTSFNPLAPLSYKKNKLYFDALSIEAIARKHPTPFYAYSLKQLHKNFSIFKQAAVASGIKNHLICFALKANANHQVLSQLAHLGSGADIVSGGELKAALKAGIPAHKIVFSGVGKTEKELNLGLQKDILSFNVESLQELELLNFLAKKKKIKASVALRLNPHVETKTHKYISTGYKSHKFGILKKELLSILDHASSFSAISFDGLSMHIGSQLTELSATAKAMQELTECVYLLQDKIKKEISFVDVGGGLGIPYHPQDENSIAT
nr:alanine racemase [Bacteriovoracaceae bacterium]